MVLTTTNWQQVQSWDQLHMFPKSSGLHAEKISGERMIIEKKEKTCPVDLTPIKEDESLSKLKSDTEMKNVVWESEGSDSSKESITLIKSRTDRLVEHVGAFSRCSSLLSDVSINSSKYDFSNDIPSGYRRTYTFYRNRFSSREENIIQQGWLIKQGFHIHNWKRRYFILGSDAILRYYYEKPASEWERASKRGEIFLEDVDEIVFCDLEEGPGILINTLSRTYKLRADNLFTLLYWMITLENTVQTAQDTFCDTEQNSTEDEVPLRSSFLSKGRKSTVNVARRSWSINEQSCDTPVLFLDRKTSSHFLKLPTERSTKATDLKGDEVSNQKHSSSNRIDTPKRCNSRSSLRIFAENEEKEDISSEHYTRPVYSPDLNILGEILRKDHSMWKDDVSLGRSGSEGKISELDPGISSPITKKEDVSNSSILSMWQESTSSLSTLRVVPSMDNKEIGRRSFRNGYSKTSNIFSTLSQEDRDVIKHGWLVKQGARVKNWKRRYFILTRSYLCYYHEKPDFDGLLVSVKIFPRGVIKLQDIHKVILDEIRGISLMTSNREYKLLANQSDIFTLLHWFITLENAVQDEKNRKNIITRGKSSERRHINLKLRHQMLRTSEAKLELDLYCGWLQKYGTGKVGKFLKKDQWCVLRALPNHKLLLDWYTNQHQVALKGTADFSSLRGNSHGLQLREGDASFSVETPDGKWEFFARDKVNAQDWYEAIHTWVTNRMDSFLRSSCSREAGHIIKVV